MRKEIAKIYIGVKKALKIPFKIPVKNVNGKILAQTEQETRHVLIMEGDYLKKFVREVDNKIVYDIGANIGLFTICALKNKKPAKKVYAFEPSPLNFKSLSRQIEINNLKNSAVILKIALGAKKETRNLRGLPVAGWGGFSFLRKQEKGEQEFAVDIFTVDALLAKKKIDPPRVVKIDVEGFEREVLQGMKECIKKFQPTIFIELHPNYLKKQGLSNKDIIDALESFGYYLEYYVKWEKGNQYHCIFK